MAKKGWFSMVKKLFTWETSSTKEKREKRRKWVFGRLKNKRFAAIEASKERRIREDDEEEEKNHALKVAIASAAAAEAAITAAQAAVEVIRIQSSHQHKGKYEEEEEEEEEEEIQHVKTKHDASQCQRKIEESSAIKVQTAFRGYLARKALKALKGIVKLQAIIRGRAVRRQAMSTLKCLQSIVSIQSQVIARKLQMVEGRRNSSENEEMQSSADKIIRMDSNSERRWDDKILVKKEVDGSCMIKKEAALRRDGIKEYSYYHRKSAESERNKVNGRWRYWMEQWVDTQLSKSKELEDSDSVFSSNYERTQLKIKQMHKQNEVEGLDSPIFSSFPSSPSIPTYMAATKSTKAKVRSSSTPRTREVGGNYEMNSDFCYSPCKRKMSILASNNNEVLGNGRNNQQRSPSLKGLSRP